MPHNPFYSSPIWKRTRSTQLHKFPYCWTCGLIGFRTRAVEVDHIVAIASGGHPTLPANLRSLCKTHHSQKTMLLDGAHSGSGKILVVTGPDGFPVQIERSKRGNQKN